MYSMTMESQPCVPTGFAIPKHTRFVKYMYGSYRSYGTLQINVCLEARASSTPYLFGVVYFTMKGVLSNCLCLLLPSYSPHHSTNNNLSSSTFIYHLAYSIIVSIHQVSKPNRRVYYGTSSLFQLNYCSKRPGTNDGYTIQADPYAHLFVREQFDWWEDVENDIAMEAKAIHSTSTVPTTSTKLVFIPTSISLVYFRRDILTVATLFSTTNMRVFLCGSNLTGARTSRMTLP